MKYSSIIILNICSFLFCINVYGINTCPTGWRVNNGATVSVDCHSTCQKVTNSSGVDQFISTKTSAEWISFRDNTPSGISLASCVDPSFWGNCIGDCSGATTFSCPTGKFMYRMVLRSGGWVDQITTIYCASSSLSTGSDDFQSGTSSTVNVNIGGSGGSEKDMDCSSSNVFITAFQATTNSSNYVTDIQGWCDNIMDSIPTDNVRPSVCGADGTCGSTGGTNILTSCTDGLGITKVKVKASGSYVGGIQIRCGSATDP